MTTQCEPRGKRREAVHSSIGQAALTRAALTLIGVTLLLGSAGAEDLLLGNHLFRAESSKPVADEKSTTAGPLSCDSCLIFRDHQDSCMERWTLMQLCPRAELPITVAGWQQVGYTEQSTGLFNTNPNRVNLHQSWLYAEKPIDTSERDWDWGFRADVMYGTDADDTQAFGNDPGEWDYLNGFDHGIYGWALPQLYGEVAFRDLAVSVGHFYTIVGYELVTAPGNFFFSHSYTFYNTEPFTATGVVTKYTPSERLTVYNCWTLGWDSGFNQRASGTNYIGGVRILLRDDSYFTYATTFGNFGARGRDAYMHSMIAETQLTERVKYVLQNDLLRVNETGEDNVGVCQYLLYTLNERVALGTRVEWWKGDAATDFTYGGQIAPPTSSSSYYEATFGVNVRPHSNFVMRPEFRYDWAPFADYTQSIFAVDMILTY